MVVPSEGTDQPHLLFRFFDFDHPKFALEGVDVDFPFGGSRRVALEGVRVDAFGECCFEVADRFGAGVFARAGKVSADDFLAGDGYRFGWRFRFFFSHEFFAFFRAEFCASEVFRSVFFVDFRFAVQFFREFGVAFAFGSFGFS